MTSSRRYLIKSEFAQEVFIFVIKSKNILDYITAVPHNGIYLF